MDDLDPGALGRAFFAQTDLDATTLPAFKEQILRAEAEGVVHQARSYPGFPSTSLPRPRRRWFTSLDRALRRRRSARALGTNLPTPRDLGHLLGVAHGVNDAQDRGPTPSAGGLQALELYVLTLTAGWLDGCYHYDRAAHRLARVAEGRTRAEWAPELPSLDQFEGGSLVVVLVGETARVYAKYADRGARFLLLEAGHLMQSLSVVASTLGLCVLPLGGVCERGVAQALCLPQTDQVLYAGACGEARR